MKIKTKEMSYEQVMALPRPKRRLPSRPLFLLQAVIRLLTAMDLRPSKFTCTKTGMEKIAKNQPCLILMNHSSFVDLKIVSRLFFPKRYGIVCTSDGYVGFGKPLLMQLLGCIPTRKFVSDITLIQDMEYMLKKKKQHVLMFPEASYSFDGTATPLPRKMGILLKKLAVPVIMVQTYGAFAKEPLYNGLQQRKVPIHADMTCLLTPEQIKEMSVAQLDEVLDNAFSFDNFKWQQDNKIAITEPFRADGLNRILYRCPHCHTEGKTEGKGIHWTCHNCGKQYELTELGHLKPVEGEAAFTHVPDWYAWQRQQVRQQLEEGTYRLDTKVKIGMMVDYKAIYMVGEGRLVHDENGFRLTGCDGKLDYSQAPLACYNVYSDYFWYELGDMICIGNQDVLFYCFPQDGGDVVAKTRLAQEELYKLKKNKKRI